MVAAAAGTGIKVAIIGSGPSGFYTAARLLAQNAVKTQVHMYERLPTPHGLVRYGVAPDHPEVKNVENKFAQVAEDDRFRFFGNVNIVGSASAGTSISSSSPSPSALSKADAQYSYPLATRIPFSSLLPHYTHILLSYGSSLSRPLGIPGSAPGELFHVHPALDFVNWYNGHPAAHDEEYLAERPWRRIELQDAQHATIVGAGNVALDVARILLRSSSTLRELFQKNHDLKSRAGLRETDIPEAVLAQLSKSRVSHVNVVARRGPAQVSFTNKELREMMDLQGVHYQPLDAHDKAIAARQIQAMEEQQQASKSSPNGQDPALLSEIRVRKRLLGILEKGSREGSDGQGGEGSASAVRWSTSFFQSPRHFVGRMNGNRNVVKQIEWDEMAFQGSISPTGQGEQSQPWSASAAPASNTSSSHLLKTGNVKTTETDLVINSVGYKGSPLDEADPIQTNSGLIPWDAKRGVIPNRGGRVLSDQGKAIPGLYVSGWLASGPVGVIASTRIDANSVADQMLHDWQQSPKSSSLSVTPQEGEPETLRQSSLPVVSWSDWKRLDAEEVRRGKELGKLREKVLCEWQDHYSESVELLSLTKLSAPISYS